MAYMQFPAVLLAMMVSTIPISLLTTRFIMEAEPFWAPEQYIEYIKTQLEPHFLMISSSHRRNAGWFNYLRDGSRNQYSSQGGDRKPR